MLRGEEQLIGQKTGVSLESALSRYPRQFRKIIAFREMAEDDESGPAVVLVLKELCRGVIGEVADAGKHSLFNRPGIGSVAQHLEIVVGFEQEEIESLELGLDVGWDVAEVGGDPQAHALGAEDEPDRIGGVVGEGEGADSDVADCKGLAGLEVLHRGKPGGIFCMGGGECG